MLFQDKWGVIAVQTDLLGVGLHGLVSWLPASRAHLIRVALHVLNGLWTPTAKHTCSSKVYWVTASLQGTRPAYALQL